MSKCAIHKYRDKVHKNLDKLMAKCHNSQISNIGFDNVNSVISFRGSKYLPKSLLKSLSNVILFDYENLKRLFE